MRRLTFAQAINDGLAQACELCADVIVLGQVIDYRPGIFGTTSGLIERFGPQRIHDFPVAESLMTMAAMGASTAGFRPVLVHQRLDFMLFSLDAIVNWLSLWRFKSNGRFTVPVTIRAVVGKGWGQGPQHSKSLHAWFAHLPGLRVAMPSTPYDAKGLLLESIFGENPTIIIEHRSLFSMEDHVPEIPYRVRFGRAACRRQGQDVTIAAVGLMVPLALRAAERLAAQGIECEVIDLRTVSPLDTASVLHSVRKTRRLVVADPTWHSVGIAAEVISSVTEQFGRELLANPARLCFPDSHTPMSAPLEEQYYPTEQDLIETVRNVYGQRNRLAA
jgi:acetoin:2,6-dichlorophenolindophenol oxidoreductase subunit beta